MPYWQCSEEVFLEDVFSRYKYTLKSSYVVSDVPWCFLHWSLGLNKRSPTLVWKAPQGSPALCGGCTRSLVSSCEGAAPGGRLPGTSSPGLHRNFRPFVSRVLPGCRSFCLRYTVEQETFFPHHTYNSELIQTGSFKSGAHYHLALVFSSCANCAVPTMITKLK